MKLTVITFIFLMSLGKCNSPGNGNVNIGPVPVVEKTGSTSDVSREWKPAIFKGLIIGRATRDQFRSVLGTPLSSGESSNDLPVGSDPGIYETYPFDEGFTGKLELISEKKTGIVEVVSIYPDSLSFQDLKLIYGDDFIFTKYEFLECPGDAGSSPVRESVNGTIEYLEYRGKGIVVELDDDKKEVKSIAFIGRPLGVTDCLSS